MNDIKPNYLKIAKQLNCDARTVKKYFLNCQNLKRKPRIVVKVLDAYEELVIEKLDLGANAYSIFNFMKKHGYKGGYTTVKNLCANKYNNDKQYKALELGKAIKEYIDWYNNERVCAKLKGLSHGNFRKQTLNSANMD